MFARIAAASVLCFALVSGAASAESPAALVTAVSGTSRPALKPFSELASGAAIDLGSSGKLSFVHYRTCRAITVVGGTIHITVADFSQMGGQIESDVKQACPRQLALVAPGTAVAGGLVMRGVSNPAPLPNGASILLVGRHADDIKAVQFLDGPNLVAETLIVDRRIAWPDSKPSLKPGSDYRMVLRDGSGRAVEKAVRVTSDPPGFFLVRLD